MTIWKIFARLPSGSKDSEEYAAECYRSGIIAVGWSEVGNLNNFASREVLKKKFKMARLDNGKGAIAQEVGCLWNFRSLVKAGDYVVCPDRESGRYYIGKILSKNVYYDKKPLGGRCKFAHRRKVRWIRILQSDDIKSIWPDGFGGLQTVSKVWGRADRLRKLLRRRNSKVGRVHLPTRPDMEWGRAAEERAMKWLRRDRGYDPENVADQHLGWDISCGEERFEVKGRKSFNTAIRLTENEWKAAKTFGRRYTILLFTAPTLEKLKTARPVQIPNPTETERWNPKTAIEYILVE